MKYVIIGIGSIILGIVLLLINIFIAEESTVGSIVIGFDIAMIIMAILVVRNGFRIIKQNKEIELLKMWPNSN